MKISAEDVDFHFEQAKVLDDISFFAGEGDLIGVIGPNGSGKTTLLKTLSGILRPKNGTVYIDMKEMSGLSPRDIARDLAVVPQETAVNFDFTSYEMVMMGRTPHIGRLQRVGPSEHRLVEEVMELTGTTELRDRGITTLSGGERQKVIIAKALAQAPSILLLDEPTANLDISNQIEIMELIKDAVHKKGITVVMAIHDINLAARYCSEMVLLKEGRVFAKGPPKKVLTPENIKAVFKVSCIVNGNPADGSVFVVPIAK